MKKLLTVLACTVALGGAVYAAAPVSAAVPSYDQAQISMGLSFTGLCLNDKSWASAPGSPVVIWTCQAGNKSEDWTVSADGTISPQSATGDVLDIVGGKAVLEPRGSQADGAWTGGNRSTSWLVENTGLTASNGTETVLNDPAYSHANGTQLIAWKQTVPTENAQFNVPAPPGAMTTGATFYGATDTSNGHYALSNCRQGGIHSDGLSCDPGEAFYPGTYDDNGIGACGDYPNLSVNSASSGLPSGKPVLTWAEDGKNGNINDGVFGSLPCGTKLQITYHGRTVVAEKADISAGGDGADGSRGLDMWWQTAKALCFTNQPDTMTVQVVPASTPTTPAAPYDPADASTAATC